MNSIEGTRQINSVTSGEGRPIKCKNCVGRKKEGVATV